MCFLLGFIKSKLLLKYLTTTLKIILLINAKKGELKADWRFSILPHRQALPVSGHPIEQPC
jgi:hypothetical protein